MGMPPPYRCSRCDCWKPLEDFPPSKSHNKGQWCRQCLREDARRRLSLKAHDRTLTCAHCGTTFTASDSRATFCSRLCKDRNRKDRQIAEREASKPERFCVWCEAEMPQSMRADAKFCSERCNELSHRQTKKIRQRTGYRSKAVSLAMIAKRDNYRCGLCGGKVNMVLKHPDPMFATLDHIIPLSRNGDHTAANLQLAHLRCNLSKSDRAANEQLRLM